MVYPVTSNAEKHKKNLELILEFHNSFWSSEKKIDNSSEADLKQRKFYKYGLLIFIIIIIIFYCYGKIWPALKKNKKWAIPVRYFPFSNRLKKMVNELREQATSLGRCVLLLKWQSWLIWSPGTSASSTLVFRSIRLELLRLDELCAIQMYCACAPRSRVCLVDYCQLNYLLYMMGIPSHKVFKNKTQPNRRAFIVAHSSATSGARVFVVTGLEAEAT